MAFVLAHGVSRQAGRIVVVAAGDGQPLHPGADVGPGARFEIRFDADPRPEWRQRGIDEIGFAVIGGGMERHAHGPERRLRWRLHELPLVELELDVEARAAALGGVVEMLSVQETVNIGTNGAGAANGQTTGVNAHGADVAALQLQLTTLGYAIPAAEQTAKSYGVGTRDAVSQFQGKSRLPATGVADEFTRAALADAVAAQTGGRQVQGRIVLDNGLPANGLKVRIYNRVFGGSATPLGEAVTDANGYYTLPYGAAAKNLEVRTVDAQGKETPLSTTRFGARNKEIFNLVAPAGVKPALSEYQRLTTDLAPHVGGALGTARENNQQQDLSLLHQATGWDARLVALAATAAQQSAQANVPAEALYALYRSGLPTDPVQLARAGSADVEGALKAARDAGVISMNDEQIKSAQESVTRAAPALLLAAKAPGALSTFSQLLAHLPSQQQTQFAQLYLQHPDGGQPLWDAAKAAGFTDPQISTLRLQGKLAYLTLNNASLLASLRDEIGTPENVSKLADARLYRDDAWRARLDRLSGGDAAKLKTLIPPAYNGDADLYSADLARRVRISFPTHVVTNLIENDELKLGTDSEHAAAKGPVSGFLRKALPLGFRLGRQSVARFVKQNHDQLFGQGQDVEATVGGVKRLQRLFQMTPSDGTLQTMYRLGFQSSHDVARYSEEEFVAQYANEFDDQDTPRLIARRSQQISAATYAFFTLTKQLDDTTTVYGYSANQDETQQIKDGLIERFPTIEQLFGAVDFCACKECRSVLSPAAYLVDLLHMLDPDSGAKPIDVLDDRRPDLVNLPLSCENTNTVLPYVDIVNEILEYYVANGALDAKAVRDTSDAKSEDLISEPQNILKDAYDLKLKSALYPLGLPFNLWLATVRGFLDHFDTPFWQLLELFRVNDELFTGAGAGYYRASVSAEMLRISPQEYGVFTNANPLPKWLDLYGETDATKLPNAQYLSRKLGVSYEELATLVQTWFVNPGLDALVPLRRLSLPLDQIYGYKKDPRYPNFGTDESNAFLQHLQDIKDRTGFDAKAWVDATWQSGAFDRALVLYDTGAGCDFSKTTLLYANGNAAEPLVLIRLNYFVRLWRKLGWSIDLVDQALRVFMPTDPNPITDKDLGKAMASALAYLAHLYDLAARLPVGKDARLKLLSLWAPLSTRGQDPLYAKLFLTPSVLKLDAATFDSIEGKYLPNTTTVKIDAHQSAVQAALNLTADEIAQILQAGNANATPANTLLTLDNVSQLYRHGILAHALKISVADLLELIKLAGLQPFQALEPKAMAALADDHPLKETLGFVDVAEAVRASGFTVESLAYVWAHQFDPAGKYADDETALLSLVHGLSGDIAQILSQNAIPADAATITNDWIRQRLALVLSADVAEKFLGMWTGAIEYQSQPQATTKVIADALKGDFKDPRVAIGFDEVKLEVTLTFRGVLVSADETTLLNGVNAARKTLAKTLLDDVHGQARAFFDQHLASSPNGAALFSGADFDNLFTPIDKTQQAQVDAQRLTLANAVVPVYEQSLIRQAVVQRLSAGSKTDPRFFESLLTDTALLQDPSATGEPLLDGFVAAAAAGVTAQYFDAANNRLGTRLLPTATTVGRLANTDHAQFDGWLEVPASGAYRFFIHFDDAATEGELHVAGRPDPLIPVTTHNANDHVDQFLDLQAGVPYPFTLLVRKLGAGEVTLTVQGETLAEGSLSRLRLYPSAAVQRVQFARILLAKVQTVIESLSLDERELRHFAAYAADFDGLDLGKLPVSLQSTPAPIRWFLRLAAYGRLKRDLGAGPDDLIAIFETARRAAPPSLTAQAAAQALLTDLIAQFAKLTRRAQRVVQGAVHQLGFDADLVNHPETVANSFANEIGVGKLWGALQMAQRLGLPVETLAGWAVPDPTSDTARDVRNAVKSRYDEVAWRQVAQSIFDPLRRKQRDALVAFIMQMEKYDRPEQLFEHFLVDPLMEPVVQTSRLRLAISSVQTFIQRCLLDLETKVAPSAIDAARWQWMKRYRVWEANRKIFLFPENWLEPEFRDDKTHLYQALEGALLQGDLANDDFVEGLFHRYLKGLEEIARLQIVSTYLDAPPDNTRRVLHVVGRTFAQPHKYFYRRYENDQWTPWDPITVDIEGDSIAVAMWRQRVHVFWLSFLTKTEVSSAGSSNAVQASKNPMSDLDAPRLVDAQLNWTEQFQGKWAPRATSGFLLSTLVEGDSFNPARVRLYISGNDDDGLRVSIGDPFNRAFVLRTKTGPVENEDATTPQTSPITGRIKHESPIAFELDTVWNDEQIADDGTPTPIAEREVILAEAPARFSVVPVDNELHWNTKDPTILKPDDPREIGPLAAPFFFQDNRNTFFVLPEVAEQTLDEWDTYAVSVPGPDINKVWKDVVLEPSQPAGLVPPEPDPEARFKDVRAGDWIGDRSMTVAFDGSAVGPTGRVGALDLGNSRNLLGAGRLGGQP